MRLRSVAIALLGLLLFSCGEVWADAKSDCYQSKDAELSIRVCTRIINGQAQGNKASAYHWRGYAYNAKEQYDRAIEDYNESIRLESHNAFTYQNRGFAYYNKGNYDRAIEDYNEAIRLDPKYGIAYNNRALAYSKKGNYDRAIEDYNEAIRLEPSAIRYANRGWVYANKRSYDRATEDLNEAIRLDVTYAFAYYARGYAYANKGQYDRAIEDFNENLRLDSKYVYAYNWRGWVYANKGNYDRAIEDYNEAIRLNPEYVNAYGNRGVSYYFKGNYDRAIEDCNEAIRLDAKDATLYHNRALAYFKKRQYASARADADQALRLNEKFGHGYILRARVDVAQGQISEAKTDAEKAISLSPDDEKVKMRHGLVMLALKDYDQARQDFSGALQLKADRVQSYAGRGQAYEAQGQRTSAMADYKKAIEVQAFEIEDREAQDEAKKRLSTLEASLSVAAAATSTPPSSSSSSVPTPAPFVLGRRVALVIGNSKYQSVEPLPNPNRDATAVAAALERLGFEVTTLVDADKAGLDKAIKDFGNTARGADWAMVYFAGHGISIGNETYLIPVDAKLAHSDDVEDETVSLTRIRAKLANAKALRLVVLDACRNNPFVSIMKASGAKRAVSRGLERPNEGDAGELIAYATHENTTADDGNADHSPFTAAFLANVEKPGLEVNYLFRKIRAEVFATTNKQQEPAIYGSLGEEMYYFKPPKS